MHSVWGFLSSFPISGLKVSSIFLFKKQCKLDYIFVYAVQALYNSAGVELCGRCGE